MPSSHCFSCLKEREPQELSICPKCGCHICGMEDCSGKCLCDLLTVTTPSTPACSSHHTVNRILFKMMPVRHALAVALPIIFIGYWGDILLFRHGHDLVMGIWNNILSGTVGALAMYNKCRRCVVNK